MKDRIKAIRKENNLTQSEFGERIGVKGNTITNYENDMRNPSDAIIFSICREFNVNENWLRYGKGPKYKENDGSFTELLAELEDSDDEFIKSLIKVYMGLDEDSKKALRKIAAGMAEKYKEPS